MCEPVKGRRNDRFEAANMFVSELNQRLRALYQNRKLGGRNGRMRRALTSMLESSGTAEVRREIWHGKRKSGREAAARVK